MELILSDGKLFKDEFKVQIRLVSTTLPSFLIEEIKLLKRFQDLLSTRDCELSTFLDVCDSDLEVVC